VHISGQVEVNIMLVSLSWLPTKMTIQFQ